MATEKHSISAPRFDAADRLRTALMNAPARNGHAAAYQKWFVGFEQARKAQRIVKGRRVPGYPAPPPAPDDVRRWVDALGEARALDLADVHRTTLGRWLDGSVQIPTTAAAVLKFHAEGVPPGCGDDWRGFRWSGNALTCPDGRTQLTARELEGWHYKAAHIEALERRVRELEGLVVDMARRLGTDGAANDAFTGLQDVRSRAFSS